MFSASFYFSQHCLSFKQYAALCATLSLHTLDMQYPLDTYSCLRDSHSYYTGTSVCTGCSRFLDVLLPRSLGYLQGENSRDAIFEHFHTAGPSNSFQALNVALLGKSPHMCGKSVAASSHGQSQSQPYRACKRQALHPSTIQIKDQK